MSDPCRFVLRRRSSFIVGGLLICGALLAAGRFGSTYASYSDFHVMSGNSAGAGVWNPDPAPFAVPVECAGLFASGPAPTPIVGTEGHDWLEGGPGNDLIFALGGNDVVFGGGGNDCLVGGAGNDFLGGHGRPDFSVLGEHQHPKVSTFVSVLLEEGDDVLLGSDGKDALYGGAGQDRLYGGPDADALNGGVGIDHVFGGTGDDFILSLVGADHLFGESGQDWLTGLSAAEVDGGDSLTTPDLETDTCLFPPTWLSGVPDPVACEHPGSAGMSARSEGAVEDDSKPLDGDVADEKEPLPDSEESPPSSVTNGEETTTEGAGSSTPPGSEGSSSKPESDGPSSAPGSDASLLPTYPPAVETPPGDPSGDGSAGLDDISGDAPETDLTDEEEIG